jgi:glycerophosphoryl diester phosphodiesterase
MLSSPCRRSRRCSIRCSPSTYADGIGANKLLIIPRNPDGTLRTPTGVVDDAHAAGLLVHPFTFRAENSFLPTDLRIGSHPAMLGNLDAELSRYLATRIDGFFIDQPIFGVQVRDATNATN